LRDVYGMEPEVENAEALLPSLLVFSERLACGTTCDNHTLYR